MTPPQTGATSNRNGWQTAASALHGSGRERERDYERPAPRTDPWELNTPPGSSEYTMYRDEEADPPALVCQVGSTTLKYHLRAIDDLHALAA